MNLRDHFAVTLVERADAPALEWRGQSYSFGEIDARSNRMAQVLRARGVKRGDRLCVQLPNSIDLIDLFLAAVKLGVLLVPINILYKDRERQHILDDAEPNLFVQERDLPELRAAAAGSPSTLEPVALDGAAPAALIYTSGTTGTAKGAIITHDNLAFNAHTLIEAWRVVPDDRLLLALPLFHVHALGNGLHPWLISGFHVRLLDRFDRTQASRQFLDYRPTLFYGVPTIYVRLLETARDAARTIGQQARLFVSGSAPLPAQVLEDFRGLFGHTILERYGMTETLMNLSNPYDGERRPGSVGLPLPGVAVRIVDEAGQDVPNGETGELLVRGRNVFAGYWRREEATSAAFDGEWFRTGDLGYREPDGYHTLCGRKSDVIISGGFNIYPREIEELLLEHPSVAEAAVVGEPDPARGEVPVAYIVPQGAWSPEVLAALCEENLASFKRPRRFEQVRSLPRNALGKVQKHLLQGVKSWHSTFPPT